MESRTRKYNAFEKLKKKKKTNSQIYKRIGGSKFRRNPHHFKLDETTPRQLNTFSPPKKSSQISTFLFFFFNFRS